MLPPVAVEVALPEALHAVVVEAVVAGEGRRPVLALLAPFLRLDDVAVADGDQHRLVLQPIAPPVHVLEALEAEVVLPKESRRTSLASGSDDLLT